MIGVHSDHMSDRRVSCHTVNDGRANCSMDMVENNGVLYPISVLTSYSSKMAHHALSLTSVGSQCMRGLQINW